MNTDLRSLLFRFSGRINRAKYWTAIGIYFVISVALVLLGTAVIVVTPGSILPLYVVLAVVGVPLIISSIAVGIKRLHDRDKTGWWLLVFYLLPNVLSGIAQIGSGNLAFRLAGYAVSIWALIELGVLRGTSGPNR